MKLKFKVEKRRMKEKSVRFVVFGIVLVLLASGIGTVSAFSNSGDGDWKYYKEITVKENSGKTLTDFQVLIELNSTSFDFSKAKSDGSDIRFTDERGNTQSSLFFVDFAQHSATDSGDFVILTNGGRVYEVDPLHLSDIQLRTSAGPVNVAAVIPDLYDDSILAFTEDGKLYQCKDSENWANWNKVGDINLPSGSKMVDFAQHSAADSGDFVILTNDGKVYEVDPRHLSDIQLRASTGPFNVAEVISDRYDNSILAVTSDGFLYRATTDDDWNSWAQVGRVQLSGGSKIVGFAQHSAVTTGDFVFLTDDGKVYEVDPRRLSIFEFRTANGPSNVVAIKPNTYDNSILAVTSEGFIYRATTDGDWNAWTEVGRIHSPVKPKNELNYWIEEWDAGAKEAKIWVKVPSIPANGKTKIRMYYGNPSASAVSDGDKVFEFFDDFSRKSLDTDKWIIFGNPKMTFSNSILDISGSCGAENANGDVLESKKNFNYPLIYEAYYKYDHTPWGNYAGIGLGRYSYPVSTHCAIEVDHSCYDNKGAFEIENGDSIDGCADWVVNDWEKTKIIWTDKFVSFERGSAICTFTSSIPSQSMPVHLGDSYFNRNEFIQLYVDWIFIHKYASIEPTLTLSAECPTTKPTPAITPTPTPPTPPSGKIKAIWLYNPDKYDTPTLMTDFKTTGINTIFLSTDVNNIWKYERFVKSAHENGIEVHAMILEDPRCALKENHKSAIKAVETVLDYNDKSLAKFDGINIDTEPYVDLDLEQVWQDYITLLEAIHEKTAGKTVLSADIPRWYDEGKIKDLVSNLDFFVIMAYDSGDVGWNTASEIEDAVASEMGAIRGEGSKAVIGIGVHEGFEDKEAVGKCVDGLYRYYSTDGAFSGVSIFKYESYSGLSGASEAPTEGIPEIPTGEEKGIPGFEAIIAMVGLLAVAYVLRRRK